MKPHFLLDEMIPGAAAEALRAAGIDASAIDERPELRGSSDRAVLEHAATEGRAVVTFNCIHFLAEERELVRAGGSHAGVVLVGSKRFANSRARLPELVEALAELARSGRRLDGFVTWLG